MVQTDTGVTPSRPLLLFVDEDAQSAAGLITTLEFEGYELAFAQDSETALELMDRLSPSVVLMDVYLPVLDGFGVIRQIRSRGRRVPIIVVSEPYDEANWVAALRLGADDFVIKPFSLLELLERIKIQLRRPWIAAESAPRESIRIGEVLVDLQTREVTKSNGAVALRPKEFELLVALWRAGGTVVRKDKLLSDVWGWHCRVETRTLDYHVGALREKIEPDPPHPRHLLTVRGVGYRLIAGGAR